MDGLALVLLWLISGGLSVIRGRIPQSPRFIQLIDSDSQGSGCLVCLLVDLAIAGQPVYLSIYRLALACWAFTGDPQ